MSELEPPPVRARVYVAVPPEGVYATQTDAARWDAWFTQGYGPVPGDDEAHSQS